MHHSEVRIVGICQVRNEDVFLGQVIANIEEFCDEIIIANHKSRDLTAEIAADCARRNPRITVECIDRASDAHEIVRRYVNSPTWIFPVDGDEIYDPDGLSVLRPKILAGEYDQYRQFYGHSLHCTDIDRETGLVSGYISPASRTVTKLYNFGAIYDWAGPCVEKCLGGTIQFKPGYSAESNLNFQELISWEDVPFRLLHMCFLRRSSLDPEKPFARPQVSEIVEIPFHDKCLNVLKRIFGIQLHSPYKYEKYCRGPLVKKDCSVFFRSP